MSVRSDVYTALNGNISASVYNARSLPFLISHLPAVSIGNSSKTAEPMPTKEDTDFAFSVNSTIEIVVVVAESSNWTDEVEAIIDEIKTALYRDSSWTSSYDWENGYTESYTLAREGEKAIGIGVLTVNINNIEEFTVS